MDETLKEVKMKYAKFILLPVVMIVIGMLILWPMVTTTGFVQMLWVALMIIAMVGLLAWDFVGLKSTSDIWFAIVALFVIGGGLKAIMFFVFDWPWYVTGQQSQGLGFFDIAIRLWSTILNWWALGGLLLGGAISAIALILMLKNKKL
jgi:hypothetical protein